ncbi:hypothetical protein AB0H43_21900 [Hamadaea sp. NPDC050747]|uniref:hypothetical protein n=1 Tax=Hamadaea sp. NPDC050747 TaxID=3155789 RepID=UPI0033F4C952
MIWDSVPWKGDLLRVADSLERRTSQRRWSERTAFLIERDVMNGAYAVRKLVEARKISDELAAETVTAREHLLVGRPVDIWNRDKFYKYYDMEHPQPVELPLADFCNQVIHSWVWMLSGAEEPPHLFNGIYVSSDRKRKSRVYFFAADVLVRVFRAVAHDDIVSSVMQRDSNGDMHIVKASRELPLDLAIPDDVLRMLPPAETQAQGRLLRRDDAIPTMMESRQRADHPG